MYKSTEVSGEIGNAHLHRSYNVTSRSWSKHSMNTGSIVLLPKQATLKRIESKFQ